MPEPSVSIIIPTFNRAAMIGHAIDSALRQDTSPEIIVVDDGSTDNTASVIDGYAHDRIRYIHKEHGGVSGARNRGVREARGEFIVWLDADDQLDKEALEIYGRVLKDEPDLDILYGQWLLVDERFCEIGRRAFSEYEQSEMLPAMIHGCTVPQGGTMVRRSCFDRVGVFDEDLPYAEDYDFFARAVAHCRFRAIDQVVYLCRSHDDHLCGHDNVTDRFHEREVVNRIVERHGYAKVFPDLFESGSEQTEASCLFRMAAIMYERGGAAQGGELFAQALAAASAAPTVVTCREAGRFLYQIALLDRDLYRGHTRRCADRMPDAWPIRKHSMLAALPPWIHRRIRSARK